MPIPWLIDWWEKAADFTLPYLVYRPVALQQKFDGEIVYRRHGERTRWIYIKNKADIMEWAKNHTFSFHPHMRGKKNSWFIMDIDYREKMDFDTAKIAVEEMCRIFEDLKIEYLLKFSGGRGFHFMFEWGDIDKVKSDIWEMQRKFIRFLADRLEQTLQKSSVRDKFYRHLKKDDPIVITNSRDEEHPSSILIDELIVHEKGMIRSPWSIHPETELVSVPLKKKDLKSFNQDDAKISKINPRKIDLPKVSIKKLLKIK